MFTITGPELSLFLSVAAIMVFTPGPNTLYIVARSLQEGRGAGIASTLGVQVGTVIHIAIAALGLSAILVSSVVAFTVVRYAGAAYLVYLGLKTLLSKEKPVASRAIEPAGLRRVFSQGVVVNLLNPKTTLFFFAFLPQFVNVDRGAVASQIVVLGLILVALGTLSDVLYTLTSAGVGVWLRENLGFLRAQRYFAGTVYIGLGVLASLTGGQSK